MAETLSHHPDNINIWGKKGCELPNGNTCTACCGPVYRIKNANGTVFKNHDETCIFLCKSGCGIHNQAIQPEICKSYHCSRLLQFANNPFTEKQFAEVVHRKIEKLIDSALEAGKISMAQRDAFLDQYCQKFDSRIEYNIASGEDE